MRRSDWLVVALLAGGALYLASREKLEDAAASLAGGAVAAGAEGAVRQAAGAAVAASPVGGLISAAGTAAQNIQDLNALPAEIAQAIRPGRPGGQPVASVPASALPRGGAIVEGLAGTAALTQDLPVQRYQGGYFDAIVPAPGSNTIEVARAIERAAAQSGEGNFSILGGGVANFTSLTPAEVQGGELQHQATAIQQFSQAQLLAQGILG